MSSLQLKKGLFDYCSDYVNQRMTRAKEAMESAQNSANEESKSSAGDKYETGRAMMQIERDKNAKQFTEAAKLKKTLDAVHVHKSTTQVELGSLVITNQGIYFIAISLGKITFQAKDYFVISPMSPIGQVLLGKEEGHTVSFNKRDIQILEIT